jgi:hypothetical protein
MKRLQAVEDTDDFSEPVVHTDVVAPRNNRLRLIAEASSPVPEKIDDV